MCVCVCVFLSTLQRLQRQSAASAAEINRLKNVNENILDTQLTRERQSRFHQRQHQQPRMPVMPERDLGPGRFDLEEAELHLAASREKKLVDPEEEGEVENHALNRVKRLLENIENEHRSRSPVRFT